MKDVLSDLRNNGLVGVYKGRQQEAYIEKETEKPEPQGQDQAQPAPVDQEPETDATTADIPQDIKDKTLEIHKATSELLGMMSGEPENTQHESIGEQGEEYSNDPKAVIRELIQTSWGGDDESQAKALELMKGLVFSDSPEAKAFLAKVDEFTSGLDPSEFGGEP